MIFSYQHFPVPKKLGYSTSLYWLISCRFGLWFVLIESNCRFGLWFVLIESNCRFEQWFVLIKSNCRFEQWFVLIESNCRFEQWFVLIHRLCICALICIVTSFKVDSRFTETCNEKLKWKHYVEKKTKQKQRELSWIWSHLFSWFYIFYITPEIKNSKTKGRSKFHWKLKLL